MLTPDEICPTCHSKISLTGKRTKGADGIDSDGNPIPFWSNDPILTPDQDPLNGEKFRGVQFAGVTTDIKEIQDDRKQKESDLGIDPPTEFSDINENNTFIFDRHIIELRISTERILDNLGTSLQEYFTLDINGDTQPTGPSDTTNKDEWTDVERGKSFNPSGLNAEILLDNNTNFKVNDTDTKAVPGIPDQTFIRGLHIEDLRHPIPTSYIEKFTPAINTNISTFSTPSVGLNTFVSLQDTTTINGDIFDTYDLGRQATFSHYNIANPEPPFNVEDGTLIGVSSIQVSTNDIFNNNSHKLFINIVSESRKIHPATDTVSFDALVYNYAQVSLNKSFPEVYKRIPRKVTNKTNVEIFFDYTLNGGQVSDGVIVGTPHPQNFTILFGLTATPTVNLDNPNVFINAQLTARKPAMGGIFLKSITSFNNFSPFISTLSLSTITDSTDPFFNKQVLRIPLSLILPEFDITEKYKFSISFFSSVGQSNIASNSIFNLNPTAFDSAVTNATITLNGYRIREIN